MVYSLILCPAGRISLGIFLCRSSVTFTYLYIGYHSYTEYLPLYCPFMCWIGSIGWHKFECLSKYHVGHCFFIYNDSILQNTVVYISWNYIGSMPISICYFSLYRHTKEGWEMCGKNEEKQKKKKKKEKEKRKMKNKKRGKKRKKEKRK